MSDPEKRAAAYITTDEGTLRSITWELVQGRGPGGNGQKLPDDRWPKHWSVRGTYPNGNLFDYLALPFDEIVGVDYGVGYG